MKKTYVRIVSEGGIGDAILSTPLFKAIKEQLPGSGTIVYCTDDRHYEVFLNNPYIDRLKRPGYLNIVERMLLTRIQSAQRHVLKYEMSNILYPKPATEILPNILYPKHATEILAERVGVTLKQRQLMIFLTRNEEEAGMNLISDYTTPIAIHIKSATTRNMRWPISYWAKFVQRNPQYTFFQLGLPDEPLIPRVIDLRGKISLRVAFAVIKSVKAFVGVASSFSHATSAFGTPSVIFYGPTSPLVWGHSNNCNLDLRMPCAPCYMMLEDTPCPYGAPCMSGISVPEVERALEKQLAKYSAK